MININIYITELESQSGGPEFELSKMKFLWLFNLKNDEFYVSEEVFL